MDSEGQLEEEKDDKLWHRPVAIEFEKMIDSTNRC
jgi:hypothetical protein